MTPQKSIWNHEADKDLLLAIISEGTLKAISWPNIAAKMETKNYTFSHEACRYVIFFAPSPCVLFLVALPCILLTSHSQHFQKLRRESGGATNKYVTSQSQPTVLDRADDFRDDRGSPAKTPKKQKAPSTPKLNGKNNGKINTTTNFPNGYQDDDDEFDTPPAKRKRTVKSEGSMVDSGFRGQNAGLFKLEDLNTRVIDLDNEG